MKPTFIYRTKFLGPTNTKGARVVAVCTKTGSKPTTVGWNHEFGTLENHEGAANLCLAKDFGGLSDWTLGYYCADGNSGYLFTAVDKRSL